MSLQRVIVFLKKSLTSEPKLKIFEEYTSLPSEGLNYGFFEEQFTKQEFEQTLLWLDKNKPNIDLKDIEEIDPDIIKDEIGLQNTETLIENGWLSAGYLKESAVKKLCEEGQGDNNCPAGRVISREHYIHINMSTLFIPFQEANYLVYAADMTNDPDYNSYYEEDKIGEQLKQIIDELD
ncbi:MAG: hypothetical protein WBB43_01630 [Limnoraphis sp.]